jgi:hypothetical protein
LDVVEHTSGYISLGTPPLDTVSILLLTSCLIMKKLL